MMLANHDATHHATRPLKLYDTTRGKPRQWEFPRAEVLSVTNAAHTAEGGIYVITIRANPDSNDIHAIEHIEEKEA